MDILFKSLIGGFVTALIAWLSKKGNVLPGILPLFPTFGIIALYLTGSKGNLSGFQETAVASMKTIPSYLIFLIVCYVGADKVGFKSSLALGILAWFLVALIIFFWSK